MAKRKISKKNFLEKKLTTVKVNEDGRKTYLTDLADYLKVAKSFKQRVIVEIKVTPDDSKKIGQTIC